MNTDTQREMARLREIEAAARSVVKNYLNHESEPTLAQTLLAIEVLALALGMGVSR